MSVAGAGCSTETAEDEDDHAMNLFEIGRFLEFNFLSLSCEDLLMQHLVMFLTVIWEQLNTFLPNFEISFKIIWHVNFKDN